MTPSLRVERQNLLDAVKAKGSFEAASLEYGRALFVASRVENARMRVRMGGSHGQGSPEKPRPRSLLSQPEASKQYHEKRRAEFANELACECGAEGKTVKQLAEKLGRNKSTIQGRCKTAMEMGYVTRTEVGCFEAPVYYDARAGA